MDSPAPVTHRQDLSDFLFISSLLTYGSCFLLPAYTTTSEHYGIWLVILGPLGILSGHISWFANPLLWACWVSRASTTSTKSPLLGCIALVRALSFAFHPTIHDQSWSGSGEMSYRVGGGYYLWLLSIVLAGLAGLTYIRSPTINPPTTINPAAVKPRKPR